MSQLYEIDEQQFLTKTNPWTYYGIDARSLPELSTQEHGGEITDTERVFKAVPAGMQYWAWSIMKKYLPEHEVYLRRKRSVSISEIRPPKSADLQIAMGKLKIPNEAGKAWENDTWVMRQVKQLAQFYPSPKLNVGLATTEAILQYAIEVGEREIQLRQWAEESDIMTKVLDEHQNNIIPALVLLVQAAIMFQITKEQRAEHDRILQATPTYAGGKSFTAWLQPLRPTMKAAGWSWPQIQTFITNRLPVMCAGHNSLSDPKDLSDMVDRIQTWCSRYPELINYGQKNKTSGTVNSISTDGQDKKSGDLYCKHHGSNASHETRDCRVLAKRRRQTQDSDRNHDKKKYHCSEHGDNYTHNTNDCRSKKTTTRQYTVMNTSCKPDECLRCLGSHRRNQCTEDDMIKQLLDKVSTKPRDQDGVKCLRCDGQHKMHNCGITNDMIRVFKSCAGGQVSLNNVSKVPGTDQNTTSNASETEVVTDRKAITTLLRDGGRVGSKRPYGH